MTPRDLWNIDTTVNSCSEMALKLPWYFTCWWRSLLVATLSSVPLLSGRTVQPEITYSRILKVRSGLRKPKKRISISTNHSYYQRSSPSASLNLSNNKARISFNKPNTKRWGTKLVDVKHLPQKAFLSWHHHYKGK